ncbi:tryptophan-rich sensory protein [Weissella oryzae SG25]|uniref:Tryptophan-rich sensory protein n=1 Tax=Weissella oryzae (strain DSM 25784 / JCM 18191 / LMG 30913 / SG25) TaxID=1329250 RepID=A0A069CSN2_WEIOS|nr:TspO/MBR family protein [Weissella oryzae]GAK30243.1 tryptophan-rich sensory protein [Weissella oryzae SG25]
MKNLSIPLRAVIFSIIIIILGSVSAFSVEWVRGVSIGVIYASFRLPTLAPPQWLFGPTWILLYIMLGIYCASLSRLDSNRKSIYFLMYVQLGLNILWTVAFFTLGNFLLASIMIIIMDGLVIALLRFDQRKIKYILIPYLIWLLFASYLSLAVTILN